VKLLKQITGFVVNKPDEAKYRTLKIAAVVDKLKSVNAAVDVTYPPHIHSFVSCSSEISNMRSCE
jgi:hypothetical protein